MPSLQYKHIGSEQHLTFDSIRKLVLHQLSTLDNREAWQHIQRCYRCRSIHESLARPAQVKKRRVTRSVGSMLFGGILLVLASMSLAIFLIHFGSNSNLSVEDVSEIYSWGLMKIKNPELAKRIPHPPQVDPGINLKRSATRSLLKSIDPMAGVSGEQYPVTTLYNKTPVIAHLGAEKEHHLVKLKEIHGEITADDQPLQGVTIMVPDSKTAKVSNAHGKYYIQVPGNTASLLFIYQGKQLAKALDTTSGRLDVDLTIESMTYPEVGSPQTGKEFFADN